MKVNRNLAISENGFIFNPSTGDSFSVNELGLTIINKLKDGKSESEILDEVLDEYQVEKSVIQKDFNEFIKMIANHQLVDIHG